MFLRHLLTVTLLTVAASSTRASQFSGIIAFGDSLSDRGNTVAEFGFLLNGTDSYNSNFYADGRWSNGPTWIEVVNDQLGNGTWARNNGNALSTGTNFAWGGSTSGSGRTNGVLANLQTQILSYRLNAVVGPLISSPGSRLFAIWSGGNDVINAVQGDSSVDVDALSTTMANNIAQAITTLYDLGGRQFIVPNLPDLAQKPNYLTNNSFARQSRAIVKAFNAKLATQFANLRADLPGITIHAFDTFGILNEIFASPRQFGFTSIDLPAYVSDRSLPLRGYVRPLADDYLFWDTTHPTQLGHSILGINALQLIAGGGPTLGRDVTDPTVNFNRKKTRVRGKTLRLVGNARDNRSIDRVEYKVGRRGYRTTRRTERWRVRIPLESGKNVIRVRAFDFAGNVSRVKRYVVKLKR